MTALRRITGPLVVVACLCAPWELARAHHSFAMFDMAHPVTIVGTVRELEWVSPHIWLWVDVPNAQAGAVDPYGFEGLSAGEMHRREGWSKEFFRPADTITVTYAPFRSGKNGGRLVQVTLPDGRSLKAGAGDGAPPAAATP